jgi:hypothetical protein
MQQKHENPLPITIAKIILTTDDLSDAFMQVNVPDQH